MAKSKIEILHFHLDLIKELYVKFEELNNSINLAKIHIGAPFYAIKDNHVLDSDFREIKDVCKNERYADYEQIKRIQREIAEIGLKMIRADNG